VFPVYSSVENVLVNIQMENSSEKKTIKNGFEIYNELAQHQTKSVIFYK